MVRDGDRYTKRCRRWDTAGQAHALTFGCYRNRPFLAQERTCDWLAEAIDSARQRHAFDLWAYVFMPDHVHLVIYPTREGYSISRILLAIKQPVSRNAIHYLKSRQPEGLELMATGQQSRPYHFWQKGGGYDRNITRFETLIQTVKYIHNNPVRRGLVALPEQWRYSSAGEWEGDGVGPLTIDRDSFPTF
jgi:REP-associated tyrosine transposase